MVLFYTHIQRFLAKIIRNINAYYMFSANSLNFSQLKNLPIPAVFKCSELTFMLTNSYETLHGKVKLIYFHIENDCLELILIVIPQR